MHNEDDMTAVRKRGSLLRRKGFRHSYMTDPSTGQPAIMFVLVWKGARNTVIAGLDGAVAYRVWKPTATHQPVHRRGEPQTLLRRRWIPGSQPSPAEADPITRAFPSVRPWRLRSLGQLWRCHQPDHHQCAMTSSTELTTTALGRAGPNTDRCVTQ